ncbi:MAG: response regulator [Candidatus Methanoperedenaceae archaeon]|nr:response regulator [Candidatus Methanoperedenaceae archaeon]
MIQKNEKFILIVNGNPNKAELFAELFLSEDYVIDIANTGDECLSILKTMPPDVILLDIELPDIDGWELIEKIKEANLDIPVIVLLSTPPAADILSNNSIVSEYLMKPVTIDGILMAVKDAVEIPNIFDESIELVKNTGDKNNIINLLEDKYFKLLKQNIYDKKLFFLLKQLYPDEEININFSTKSLLDELKNKISATHSEIDVFKNGYDMKIIEES